MEERRDEREKVIAQTLGERERVRIEKTGIYRRVYVTAHMA